MTSQEQGPFGIMIARRSDQGLRLLGSGSVVGPGLILTAWHVVEGRGDLVVMRGPKGNPIQVTAVLPKAEPTHDVALLRVGAEGLPVPATLAFRAIENEDFQACGYPKVHLGLNDVELEPVQGRTNPASNADAVVKLDVTVAAQEWGGLSGAAVRVDGKVVAVVRGSRTGWGPLVGSTYTHRITATPLAIVMREEAWFGEAFADRRAVEEEYERHRQSILNWLTRELDSIPALKAALHRELGGELAVLPARLLDTSGLDVAIALCNAIDGLPSDPKRYRALWTGLLPLLADLRPLVVEAGLAQKSSPRQLELAWREESLAAVVLAAVERKDLRLVDHPKRAVWAEGFYLLPTVLKEGALRCTPENVQSAVDMDLDSLGAQLVKDLSARSRDLVPQVLRTREKLRNRPTIRLVLADEDLGAEAGEVWRVVCTARLPELHLLRLKGGLSPEQLEEGALHDLVANLHKATRS